METFDHASQLMIDFVALIHANLLNVHVDNFIKKCSNQSWFRSNMQLSSRLIVALPALNLHVHSKLTHLEGESWSGSLGVFLSHSHTWTFSCHILASVEWFPDQLCLQFYNIIKPNHYKV